MAASWSRSAAESLRSSLAVAAGWFVEGTIAQEQMLGAITDYHTTFANVGPDNTDEEAERQFETERDRCLDQYRIDALAKEWNRVVRVVSDLDFDHRLPTARIETLDGPITRVNAQKSTLPPTSPNGLLAPDGDPPQFSDRFDITLADVRTELARASRSLTESLPSPARGDPESGAPSETSNAAEILEALEHLQSITEYRTSQYREGDARVSRVPLWRTLPTTDDHVWSPLLRRPGDQGRHARSGRRQSQGDNLRSE